MKTYMIQLGEDLFAVYSSRGERGPYGTPMLCKGTLAECLEFRKGL